MYYYILILKGTDPEPYGLSWLVRSKRCVLRIDDSLTFHYRRDGFFRDWDINTLTIERVSSMCARCICSKHPLGILAACDVQYLPLLEDDILAVSDGKVTIDAIKHGGV